MDTPLVSIICVCKNSKDYIRQCIESLLTQTYDNFEFLIQDGASIDGTVEIIKEYSDKRIKLISEPDSGPGEAFVKVINRVRGVIWGSCLSDEEMLPHAIQWAVDCFKKSPDAAAIYGDAHIIDENGAVIQSTRSHPWDYKKYLCCEVVPPFSATFFRTKCFKTIGYDRYGDCGEFDIWLRLGKLYNIEYSPQFVTNFRRHSGSNTTTTSDFHKTLPGRIKAIEMITDAPDAPEQIRLLKMQAIAGLYLWVSENFISHGHFLDAGKMIESALNYAPHINRLIGVTQYLVANVDNEELAEKLLPVIGSVTQYVNSRK